MEEERDILAFKSRLEDRFGKLPPESLELIRVVRLRRIAKKLGMEKLVLKLGVMTIHLIANNDSPYYKSEAFDKLLRFITNHPKDCSLKEQNGKRTITIKHVSTVEKACDVMNEIENQDNL
jgi:transcription-repair coupling factor (superfamily II helicase)